MFKRPKSLVSVCGFAMVWTAIVSTSAACGNGSGVRSAVQTETPAIWEYPVRLGDPRTEVHELLGAPDDATLGYKEAYPASGVEAWFDAEGRVTKLSFNCEASALYQAYSVQIPSDRILILGLTAHTTEEGFLRALGSSVQQNEGGRPEAPERHYIWKTKGLLIDAEFLASDRTKNGRTYRKGSLLWFYVSRAL